MLDRLESVAARFDELGIEIAQPEVIADLERWRGLMKEHAELAPLAEKFTQYKGVLGRLAQAREMATDAEMREMAAEEIAALEPELKTLEHELRLMLLPKDVNDERNVIVEIRAGAGGDEAGLFGADLMRMYQHYADGMGWRVEPLDVNLTELGGVKEVSFMIDGRGAYSRLKFESGVHRVQRVPDTEASGRIHTSTTTVAVLPEAGDVEIELSQNDLRIDTYRAGGAGGQHVNRTDSAVRITHMPTGIVVQCQNERSQLQNREQAMRMLRAKLYDEARQKATDEYSKNRKSQIGTGDRSERIRTYNFPQGRVTDHRIGLTLYKLDSFMNGDLDEVIDALILADQSERLRE